MTWEDVRDLDPHLIEIGAHTCTHSILSRCSVTEQRREIMDCKRTIEERTQRAVTAFCYPNGESGDFTDDSVSIVREAGFTSAVTACAGMIETGSNPYRLPRIAAPDEL